MANPNFTCTLEAWRSGTTLYGRMHYYRSGSYLYKDTNFPTPTMDLGGTVYYDTDFANRVHSGIYVGDVYSTTFSRTVAGSGNRTVTWTAGSGIQSDFAGTWSETVYFPSTVTAPTGLSASNVVSHVDGFSAKISVTGWGGAGDASSRARGLSIRTYDASSLITPRIYTQVFSNTMSSVITATNSQHTGGDSGFTIAPNTRYTLSCGATNGTLSTSQLRIGNYVTLASAPVITYDVSQSSVEINYSVDADGGFYDTDVEYSLDGGTTWTNIETITGGVATIGSVTIPIDPNANYVIYVRTNTTAGASLSDPIVINREHELYGSYNEKARRITKLYGSSSNQSVAINKLYGSVNGESKIILQSFGHLNYD